MGEPRPVILILGPTASGKSELAIALARSVPGGGECLSADSMQVYRGMDVGTAKPSPEQRAEVPHHLLDLVEPADEGFNVDRWLALAERTIASVRLRGRHPIVVGGTNLYVQALLEGLLDGPAPQPALRARLQALDTARLRTWLGRIDPPAAARIHPNDRKRSIRAIEVHELTGRRLSDLQQQWHAGRPRRDVWIVGLDWPVDAINARINARVRAMIDEGLVEEVRGLWAAGRIGPQAGEALGYRQIIDHLEGRIALEQAVEQIKIRTRRFAKQQRTWLRRFRRHRPSLWLECAGLSAQDLFRQAVTWIEERSAPAAWADDHPTENPCPDQESP